MSKETAVIIHEKGKIDIHDRQRNLKRALIRIQDDINMCQENKNLIVNFIDDCLIGKTVIGKSKKKIGPATCLKYLNALPKLSHAFGKSFNQVTQKDMEAFIRDLEYDSICSRKGTPYSDETKVGIKKAIKKFWKWKDGENKIYPDLVEWIDTFISVKDVPALRREEVEKMIEYASNPRNKALLMILFDSGARIEELLNVRLKKEHLFWNDKVNCFMIRLEFSKTKPRTISIPFCTDVLNKWLLSHPANYNPDSQLFPLNYGNARMLIKRIGDRVLNKRVTPHMLRHSSATFYANKLNRYQLCYRFGWTMSSKQVDRYIDREGLFDENTAVIIKTDEISKANKESSDLREEFSLVKESHSELITRFDKMKQELDSIYEGKNFMKILMSIIKQQQKMSDVLEKLSGLKFEVIIPNFD